MRRKLGFCMKTSPQSDPKIHLKILSQSLQYERYNFIGDNRATYRKILIFNNCCLFGSFTHAARTRQGNKRRGRTSFLDEAAGVYQPPPLISVLATAQRNLSKLNKM